LPPPEINETVGDAFEKDGQFVVGDVGDTDDQDEALDFEIGLDDANNQDKHDHTDEGSRKKSPFEAWMLEPIVWDAISKTPI
jgi:hypothetical protein